MTSIRSTAARAFAVAVGAAATLVVAAPAQAAGSSWAYVDGGNYLVVQAATGARNTFYMRDNAAGFDLYDTTGTILLDGTRTGGCVRPATNMITCPYTVVHTDLALADLDDFVQNDTTHSMGVRGGAGNDTVLGGHGRDWIFGDAGEDHLEGRGGVDSVYGGDDDDLTWGGDGDDTMEGGPGKDEAHGEAGDDTLLSTDGRDLLMGSFGRDTIQNSSTVDAGWDDDTVVVRHQGGGNLYGGAGFDVITYTNWQVAVYVSLDGNWNDGDRNAACDDIIFCPVPISVHNVHGDFERVIGSVHDDKISGNGEPDQFYGGAGNDRLYGNGGDDTLDAEAGTQQTLSGGSGDDTCRGAGTLTKSGCELP